MSARVEQPTSIMCSASLSYRKRVITLSITHKYFV